jgi:hypothetical protein
MSLLGRARAAVALEERATAEQYYDQLLQLWRNADANLEPFVDARREAARLH